jgi:arylsulfatase A-like enzyme
MTRRTWLAAAAGTAWMRAQDARRPNILFAIADDWSYGHAGAYGATWLKTPSFDRVARRGVLFTSCFTSNPKCSPCRASILTGRNSWQLKEAVNHYSIFPNEFPVYPALLEQAGYWVGFTGKGWGPGDFHSTGFKENPAGRAFQKHTLKPPYAGISNRDYARNFEDFFEQRPKGAPFCFWLGGHEPHRAYEEGLGVRAGRDPAAFYPNQRVIRSDMLDYALEVEWFDQHVGQALDKLEKLGELDNTLVVMTSDHGMPFPRVKGQIYEGGYHVPLAVSWASQMQDGRTVDDFINVRDFAPTFLEAAGLKPPATVTGRSFVDVLKSNRSGTVDEARNVMLIGKERHDLGRPNDAGYPVRGIRTRDYLYVRNYEPDRWPTENPETGYRNVDDGPTKEFLLRGFDEYYRMSFGKRPAEELYYVRTDPDCMKNLATDLEYARIKRDLQERLDRMLREEGDPRALGNAAFLDTIQYTGPRRHAYSEWEKNSK